MDIDPKELPDFNLCLTHLAEAFRAFKIPYAVIGGLAMGFRGKNRMTEDLDFLLEIPAITVASLVEELKNRGFGFNETFISDWTQHHMVVVDFKGLRVDWLKPVIPVFNHVIKSALDEPWHNVKLRVASPEGLILTKLISFRSQDRVDIETILAANKDCLKIDWIQKEWETIAETTDPNFQEFLKMAKKIGVNGITPESPG